MIVVSVFLWVYSVFTFLHFSDENYVGALVEINETSFIVDDGKIGNTEVQYNKDTKIFSKNTDKELKIGTHIFVSTHKDEN
jgi:hypothetical protein